MGSSRKDSKPKAPIFSYAHTIAKSLSTVTFNTITESVADHLLRFCKVFGAVQFKLLFHAAKNLRVLSLVYHNVEYRIIKVRIIYCFHTAVP